MFFARCLVFFRMRKNALKMSRKPLHFSTQNILEKLKHSEQVPRLCIAVSAFSVMMKRADLPVSGSRFKADFSGFVSLCVSSIPKGEKYKAYILKYKALILK